MKRCSVCAEVKPLEAFHRNREHADGRQGHCAECQRERARRWRAENAERAKQREREYRRAHPEKGRARARAHYERNRARLIALAVARHRADPESQRVIMARRRARKRDAYVEHVEPLVVLERDDGVCGICGDDVDPRDFHTDHVVPLARGGEHSYANVQLAHPRCNWSKSDRLP